MTIIYTTVTGVANLILSYQVQNVKNEIQLGAISAGEQLMEQLRQCSVTTLPKTGKTSIPANNTSTRSPCGTTILPLTYSTNKFYSAEITYCASSTYCDNSTRQVAVQIFYDKSSIFKAETVFTALQ